MSEPTTPFGSPQGRPASAPAAVERHYVGFVALGDSATSGVGEPAPGGTRHSWARILAEAISESHDLSFCNVAEPGSTTEDVWLRQLPDALGHRAHLAALIVGLNDTMRASWDRAAVRTYLLMSAAALTSRGAILMTVRFHEHARVMRLPRPLARLMTGRVEELNEILDEVHRIYGGIRVDLSDFPEVYDNRFWSVDRLHPSEFGHRALATRFAEILHDHGLRFPAPHVDSAPLEPRRLDTARWLCTEVAPWLGRRARRLGTEVTTSVVRTARLRLRLDGGVA